MPEFDTAFKETCITSKNQKKKYKFILFWEKTHLNKFYVQHKGVH